eukprot:TRINITY_DN1665_c0_g1_i1.p1 TRINITY_DN1665_c0_g1~~TRINITY_DN1665_c0_g1_i1.p1  ORF type:complete len:1140 (-),score=180.64 TRINITY_DN1665_c0_g1_i1:11-3085(-)
MSPRGRGGRAHSVPRRARSDLSPAGVPRGRSVRRASSQGPPLVVIPEKSLEEEPLKHGGVLGPVASRSGAGSGWVSVLHDATRRSFVSHRPNPFTKEQLSRWFKAVRANLNWDRPEVNGKKLPRSACWLTAEGCCCTYRYSGTAWPNVEMSPWFMELTDAVCKACGLKELPNSCNANLYQDGSESVGWHADDEPFFDAKHRDALIISLSLGAARNFLVRPLSDPKDSTTLRLENGDLCTMEGMMQKHYHHAVLPESNCRAVRINLTWRWVVKHDSECIRRNASRAKVASMRSLPSEVANQIASQAAASASKAAQGLARSSNSAVAEASERADSRSRVSGKRRRSEEASHVDPPMPPAAPRDRRGDGGKRRDRRDEEEDFVDRAENIGEGTTRSWRSQRRKEAAAAALDDDSEAQQGPPSPARRWKVREERPTLPSPLCARGAAEEDVGKTRGGRGNHRAAEEDAASQGKEAAGLSSQRRDDSRAMPQEPPPRRRSSRGKHAERQPSPLPAPSKAPHIDWEDDRRGRREMRNEEPQPEESKLSQQERPHRDHHHHDHGEGQRSGRRGTERQESGRDGGTDNQDLRSDRKRDPLPPNGGSSSRADQRRVQPLPTEEAAGSRGGERGSRGSQHDPPVRSRSSDDERGDTSARRQEEGAQPSCSSRRRNDSRQPERQYREFVQAQRSRRGGDLSDQRDREDGAGLDAEPAFPPEEDGGGERNRTKPQRQSARRPAERPEREDEALPERSSGGRRGDAPPAAPPPSRRGQRAAPREPEDEGGREDREERRGEHVDRRSERHDERADFRDDRYPREYAADNRVRGHDRENAPGAGDFDPAPPPPASGAARSSDRRRRQEAHETPAAQSSRASGEQGRTWVRNRASDREERVEDETASSKKAASNADSQRKPQKNPADSRNTRTPVESAQPSSGGGSSSRVTLKESAAARSRRIDEQAGDYSRSGRDSRDPGQRSWHNRQGDEDNVATSRDVKLSRKEETRSRDDHSKESSRRTLILKPAKEQGDRDRARR